jgi:hypothetical protein
MDMNEELKNRVIADLDKSGFGSEMRAVRALLDCKWRAKGGSAYFDEDEQKTREYDVDAYRTLIYKLTTEKTISNFFHIIAEVKKSDKPWVVIKSPTINKFESTDAWNNLIFYDYLPVGRQDLTGYLSRDSLVQYTKWKGLGIHESFKPPDTSSRWYSAFVSVCKAAEYVLKTESWELKENASERTRPDLSQQSAYFVFVQPVVILDGILLSSELGQDGSIVLEEIQAAPFEFRFRSARYDRSSSYRVDLITLKGLGEYITRCQRRQNTIHEAILRFGGITS